MQCHLSFSAGHLVRIEPDRLPEDPGVCPGLQEVERSWRVESVSVKSKKPTDKLRARLKQDDVITSRLGFKPWQLSSVQSGVHQTAIWAWLSKAIGNLCIFCVYVASLFLCICWVFNLQLSLFAYFLSKNQKMFKMLLISRAPDPEGFLELDLNLNHALKDARILRFWYLL